MPIDRRKLLQEPIKDISQLAVSSFIFEAMVRVRKDLLSIKEATRIDNRFMGDLCVVAALAHAFPELASSTVDRREVVAWRNIYLEFLMSLRASKKNPQAAIDKEIKWLCDECDRLLPLLSEIGFVNNEGVTVGRVHPYFGDYINEDRDPQMKRQPSKR